MSIVIADVNAVLGVVDVVPANVNVVLDMASVVPDAALDYKSSLTGVPGEVSVVPGDV